MSEDLNQYSWEIGEEISRLKKENADSKEIIEFNNRDLKQASELLCKQLEKIRQLENENTEFKIQIGRFENRVTRYIEINEELKEQIKSLKFRIADLQGDTCELKEAGK